MVTELNYKIPPRGLLDYFTRQDELMIENIKTLRALGDLLRDLPDYLVEARQELRGSPKYLADLKRRLTTGEYLPYALVGSDTGLDMTTARDNEAFDIEGTGLVANSDGTLEGVTVRFNTQNAPPVPIKFFNPWPQRFFRLYVTHTAQSGKTLYLMASRGGSVAALASQTLGLYSQPEWAARQGIDKEFYASGVLKTFGNGISASYSVPTGKTLYIMSIQGAAWASHATDGDKNQMGFLRVIRGATDIFTMGGNGGGQASFTKPLVFLAGENVFFSCNTFANHDTNLYVSAQGYEV